MRRWMLLVTLSGCFGDFGVGGAVTPHAPAPPTGDGGYYRIGGGLGWGNGWGALQASGDVIALGDTGAIGGALRATVFLYSVEREHSAAGIGLVGRAFHGTGISNSRATDELSIGIAFAGVDTHDLMFDGLDLSFSAYRTTFDDRPEMRSYGVNLGFAADPEIVFGLLDSATSGHRTR